MGFRHRLRSFPDQRARAPMPAMDPAAFPDSRRMREEILCLPIHQDLGREEIERLASVTGRLLAP